MSLNNTPKLITILKSRSKYDLSFLGLQIDTEQLSPQLKGVSVTEVVDLAEFKDVCNLFKSLDMTEVTLFYEKCKNLAFEITANELITSVKLSIATLPTYAEKEFFLDCEGHFSVQILEKICKLAQNSSVMHLTLSKDYPLRIFLDLAALGEF